MHCGTTPCGESHCEAGCCEVSCGIPANGCGSTVSCGAAHVAVPAKPEVQVAEKQEPEIKPVALEQPKIAKQEVIPAKQVIAEPERNEIPEYAHAQDYSWLVGQLQRVHSPQHQWKIRYAALDENEQWGGSMILAPDARLDQCKDGDMVYVEGEILSERPSLYLSGPLYRVRCLRPAQDAPPVVVNIER
jgi:hypothetical protein